MPKKSKESKESKESKGSKGQRGLKCLKGLKRLKEIWTVEQTSNHYFISFHLNFFNLFIYLSEVSYFNVHFNYSLVPTNVPYDHELDKLQIFLLHTF